MSVFHCLVVPNSATRRSRPFSHRNAEPTSALGLRMRAERGDELAQASGNGRLAGRCADLVAWLLASARRRVLCAVSVIGGSLLIVLLLTPPAEYLPEGEEAKTFAMMNAPPGYNLASMQKIADQVQAHFLPYTPAGHPPDDADGTVPPIATLMMNVSTEWL